MHHKLDQEYLSPAEASAMVGSLADQLVEGTIFVGGHHFTVVGPMAVSLEVDTSHELAHISVTIDCHRPGGGSRQLQGELARPGG